MTVGQNNLGLGRQKRAVGVFPDRRSAEHALHELRDSNFPMNRISIIAQDERRGDDIAGAEVRDKVGNKADDGAKTGALAGGTLGGITGLLVGLGTLALPGIGPIMLAGAGATAIATTLAGAGIGAATGGLLGALVGAGIPEERARVYHDRVARGEYLLIVEGTEQEINRAEAILHNRGIQEYGVYDAPDLERDRTEYAPGYNVANQTSVGATPATAFGPTTMGTTPAATPMGNAAVTPGVNPMGSDRHSFHRKRAIGVFSNSRDAEVALTDLRDSGFSMNQVSLIAKDAHSTDRIANTGVNVPGTNKAGTKTGNKADEGAKTGALTGGALGGLGGLLVGLGALAIPGVGPVLLGGAAATALATAISGGAIGAAAGGLAGGLVGLGIPEDRAKVYNERFERGDYLVMVDGTEDEVRRAETILNRRGIRDWGIFDASDIDQSTRANATRTDAVRTDNTITGTRTSDMRLTDETARPVSDEPDVVVIDRRNEKL